MLLFCWSLPALTIQSDFRDTASKEYMKKLNAADLTCQCPLWHKEFCLSQWMGEVTHYCTQWALGIPPLLDAEEAEANNPSLRLIAIAPNCLWLNKSSSFFWLHRIKPANHCTVLLLLSLKLGNFCKIMWPTHETVKQTMQKNTKRTW